MSRCTARSSLALIVVPAVILAGCASAPLAPVAQAWRPAPSKAIADRCTGDAAAGCYQEGLAALSARPPQAVLAQNLLSAACTGEIQNACEVLDTRFHPPSAVRVPAITGEPPAGNAVVEFSCRLNTDGTLSGCERTRSANSTRSLDDSVARQMATAQAGGRFHPATLDGAAYVTEVRLVYVLSSQSIAGPTVFAGNLRR